MSCAVRRGMLKQLMNLQTSCKLRIRVMNHRTTRCHRLEVCKASYAPPDPEESRFRQLSTQLTYSRGDVVRGRWLIVNSSFVCPLAWSCGAGKVCLSLYAELPSTSPGIRLLLRNCIKEGQKVDFSLNKPSINVRKKGWFKRGVALFQFKLWGKVSSWVGIILKGTMILEWLAHGGRIRPNYDYPFCDRTGEEGNSVTLAAQGNINNTDEL